MNKELLVKQLLEEVEKHKPWEWCDQWQNESQYYSWLRGKFREIWSQDWKIKNDYLNSSKFDQPLYEEDGSPKLVKTGKNAGKHKTQKAYRCEATGEVLWASKPKGQRYATYNIDHIEDAGSCRNGLEACIFLFRLLTSPDNIQLLSAEYHKILTYQQKEGVSFEQAKAAKGAILIQKTSTTEKAWFVENGITPASNARLRRQQITEHLMLHEGKK
tara:strand:- start:450 stop:1097 length:648 start_codon:yes stop_codon:yes gene_type:complete